MTGRVSEWNAFLFEEQVDRLVANGVKDAELFLETKGGDVIAGNKIAHIINKFTGVINCELGVICASAGTYIALQCKTIKMPVNGLWMFHKPNISLHGNEDKIKASLKLLQTVTKDYKRIYAKATGKSEATIEKDWQEDNWMSAEEAKKYGFITEVIAEEAKVSGELTAELTELGCPEALITRATSVDPKKQINTDTDNKMNLEAIKAVAGQVPQIAALANDASEADVAKAISAALKAGEDREAALQAKLDKIQDLQVKTVIDAAVESGKIVEADRGKWDKMLRADFENGSTVLAGLEPRIDPNKVIRSNSGNAQADAADRTEWDYGRWMKEDPTGLQAMRQNKPEEFDALFEAWK